MKNPEIIYESKDILVVNKPAGLLVHGTDNIKLETQKYSGSKFQVLSLVDWLVKKYPEIKNVGDEPEMRPGIVHRLDKDTSGAMIIAKNQAAFEHLKKQFSERKIKKTYLALVAGKIKEKVGAINLAIGRSRKNPTLRAASPKARGKLREAITEYKVLEKFTPSDGVNFTLVEAYPKTGRTHQLRVHFKAIGHPVACDKIYGNKANCLSGLSRLFLHAYSLELTLPDGSRGRFEADLPADLKRVLRELRKEK